MSIPKTAQIADGEDDGIDIDFDDGPSESKRSVLVAPAKKSVAALTEDVSAAESETQVK